MARRGGKIATIQDRCCRYSRDLSRALDLRTIPPNIKPVFTRVLKNVGYAGQFELILIYPYFFLVELIYFE